MKKSERFKDLQDRVNDYFLYCDAVNETRQELVKPYTLSGLISYLGITREEFNCLIKERRYRGILLAAKAKIEAFIEENALTGELSVNASANSLKYNFGWGDKQEAKADNDSRDINITLSPALSEIAK